MRVDAHAEEHGHGAGDREAAEPAVTHAPGDEGRHFERDGRGEAAAELDEEVAIEGALGANGVEVDLDGLDLRAGDGAEDEVDEGSGGVGMFEADDSGEAGRRRDAEGLLARTPGTAFESGGEVGDFGIRRQEEEIFGSFPGPEDEVGRGSGAAGEDCEHQNTNAGLTDF